MGDKPPEQPDRAELKNWLLSSVDRELLVREAVERAAAARQPPASTPRGREALFTWLAGFFQHSAVLLLLGFLLTGVVGSALTSAWQHNSWVSQQTLLARQSALNQKYELANAVAKAIGDTHAAPSNVLIFYANEDSPANRSEFEQRVKHVRQTYIDWLTHHNVLLQKVSVHVRDPKARELFQDIYFLRKRTHNHILNLIANKSKYTRALPEDLPTKCKELEEMRQPLEDRRKQLKASPDDRAAAAELKKLDARLLPVTIKLDQTCPVDRLNEADKLAGELMTIMAREINQDSSPQELQSFWSVLWGVFGFGRSDSPPKSDAPTPTPAAPRPT